MIRRRAVVGAGAVVAVLALVGAVLAARGGDGPATAPTTAAPPPSTSTPTSSPTTVTLAPGTLPPTVAPPTTVPSTTAAAPTSTSAAPTTAAPTTVAASTTTIDPDAAPAFPCRADLLLAAYVAAQDAPPDTRIVEPRCYGIWASGLLVAPGLDRAFAVFGPGDGGWQLLNAGTAFVCQPLEVPDPAYTAVGCVDWDR